MSVENWVDKDVSVIVPTVDSADFICHTIKYYLQTLDNLRLNDYVNNYEILVMVQTFPERSERDKLLLSVLRDNGYDKMDNVRVIVINYKGKGLAVQKGVAESKYEICVIIDDDLEYELFEIIGMLRLINDNDLVIGSRFCKNSIIKNVKIRRRVLSWCYLVACRILLGLKYSDLQCGLKVVKKSIFQQFEYEQTGYVFDTELIYEFDKQFMYVAECPVSYLFRGERCVMPDVKLMLRDLINLTLAKRLEVKNRLK